MKRDEVPQRVYPGKNGLWYVVLAALFAVVIVATVAAFLGIWNTSVPMRCVLVALSVAGVVVMLSLFSNRVELYLDRFEIVYAFTRNRIPYAHVTSVRRVRTLWAGTANSLDRVLIEAPIDGDAVVSVHGNDALVDELVRRCGLRDGPVGVLQRKRTPK